MKFVLSRVCDLVNINHFEWGIISIDTETNDTTKYLTIDLSTPTYKNGISLSDGTNSIYFHNEEGELLQALSYIKTRLKDTHLVILHNAPFDVAVLRKHKLNLHNIEWFDTMVAAHLLDENGPKGLKDLAKEYLDKDTSKYDSKMSKDDFCEYALRDAEYTYELFRIFAVKIKLEGLEKLFRRIEMPFLRVVVEMNTNGFNVDQTLLQSTKTELEDYIINKEIEMLNFLGVKYQMQHDLLGNMKIASPIDLNSSLTIRKILFEDLKISSAGITATGKEKTGKDFFHRRKNSHPFAKMLWEYRTASKLLSSFIEPFETFIDSDGRMRSSFNDCGAKTGRLSASNPNFQQLPNKKDGFPEVRKLFIHSKGKKLIVADYSGQEYRVLAQITNCKPMIQSFIDGKDFHADTGEKFGVDRKTGKTLNFGIVYGKGNASLAEDLNVTESEAQGILDKYFMEFPEVKMLIEDTRKFIMKNGYCATMVGRKRRFSKNEQGYYPNKVFRQGFNHLIQGFSADMIRIACVKVYNQSIRHPEWGIKILATIHDEIVLECYEEYVPDVKEMVKEKMEAAVMFKMPIIAEVGVGDSYADAK
jgi:DNA polymerase-1